MLNPNANVLDIVLQVLCCQKNPTGGAERQNYEKL